MEISLEANDCVFLYMGSPLHFLIILLAATFFNPVCAQYYSAELLSHRFFVVQDNDATPGYYDTLALRDGYFEQKIETVFKGVGERRPHLHGKARENEPREIRRHVIVSGYLENGERTGEWFYHTSNFKAYSTCYGDLSWKRVNYQNQDTTFVYFWNGMDYLDKAGRILGGVRESFADDRLTYSCSNGRCIIGEDKAERRIEVSEAEIEMTLDRIVSFGF